MTGARVKRVEPLPGDGDVFLCTYGDGLADVDLSALLAFHRAHGRLATVTGVRPAGALRRLARKATTVGTSRRSPRRRRPDQRRLLRLRPALPRPALGGCGLRAGARAAGELARGGRAAMSPPRRVLAVRRHAARRRAAALAVERGRAPWRVWDDRSGAAPIPGDRRGAVHAVPEAALAPKDA